MSGGINLRFDIGFDIKDWFFDRPAVEKLMSKIARKALSKFGAYVRTRAKTSIRKRKGHSEPGKPPHSHQGLLRSNIFFAFDPGRRSVVVGPVALAGKDMGADVLEVLEYGGEEEIPQPYYRTLPTGKIVTSHLWGKKILAHYEARPYMQPAYKAELDNLPAIWRASAA